MMMKRRLAQKNVVFTLSCLATLNVFAKRFRAALLSVFIFLTPLPLCAQQVSSSLAISSLIMSGTTGLIRPPKTLTDPNATSESKSLMSFLVDHYGQQVLSGQQDLGEINYIYSVTGKQPAVGTFDLMDYSPSRITYSSYPTGLSERFPRKGV